MTHDLARDRERLNVERQVLLGVQAALPFDRRSELLLGKLPLPLMKELRLVLRKTPLRKDQMNPQSMADSSREILLQAVVDCCRARSEAGLETNSIEDLGMSETLAAIDKKIKIDGIDGGWGSARIAMLLAVIRKLVTFVSGCCNPLINKRQRELASMQKERNDYRVYLPEEYVAGAVAIAAFSKVLSEGGFLHSESLSRDAAILALNAKLHARLGELFRLNVGDVRHRVIADKPALSITVRMTKVHRDRIVPIQDERVVELIEMLLKAPEDAPLFRTIEGKRLHYLTVGSVLERTGNLAVGKRGGANIMRRSATKRIDGRRKEAGPLLGHKGEKTSRDHYTPNQSGLGLRLIREAASQAAEKTSLLRKSKK